MLRYVHFVHPRKVPTAAIHSDFKGFRRHNVSVHVTLRSTKSGRNSLRLQFRRFSIFDVVCTSLPCHALVSLSTFALEVPRSIHTGCRSRFAHKFACMRCELSHLQQYRTRYAIACCASGVNGGIPDSVNPDLYAVFANRLCRGGFTPKENALCVFHTVVTRCLVSLKKGASCCLLHQNCKM